MQRKGYIAMIVKDVAWLILHMKKCISCNLTKANRKYNIHNAFCLFNLFPNDPKSIKAKSSKELKTVIQILRTYPNFIQNKPFYVDLKRGCCKTKRRIDLRMLINNAMLCIEIDEH